jgi:flavin-dependent dehydrogenase
MKYDLIVAGGGPAGLMAAKTAAEEGLKVVLIERKKSAANINRACTQILYLKKLTPVGKAVTGQRYKDGYTEPVSVEVTAEKSVFHFHGPGFSVDFTGCLLPYLNWIQISPSGHQIHRYKLNDRIWGYYFHKEALISDLLVEAQKAGAEILCDTIAVGAENTIMGVRVTVQSKSGVHTLEARAAIAADGKRSKIVESLGLNKNRRTFAPKGRKFVHYIMEGVETGMPDSSFLSFTIPSINPFGNIMLSLGAGNSNAVGTMSVGEIAPDTVIDRFISDKRYAKLFRNARVIKKEGAVGRSGGALTPIKKPVSGNVVIAGDAGAPSETWVQGAIACGYQAVKAIVRELNGQSGYSEYTKWWQRAFAFNKPEYLKLNQQLYPVNRLCTDEEVDYIYKRFNDHLGIPQLIIAKNMDIIKEERPELFDKFKMSMKK